LALEKIALAIGGLMPVNFRVRVFAEARPAPFVFDVGKAGLSARRMQ
jgi:hypothetical protein